MIHRLHFTASKLTHNLIVYEGCLKSVQPQHEDGITLHQKLGNLFVCTSKVTHQNLSLFGRVIVWQSFEWLICVFVKMKKKRVLGVASSANNLI